MKRLVVLGGGESGVGAAILGQKIGMEVFVSDRGTIASKYQNVLRQFEIPFEEGKHSETLILNADEVVKSPGIPETVPLVKQLLAKDIPVISELELALRHTDAKLIGITGSNGKTTTAMLTYHILNKAGLKVGLAGNVGRSLAWSVAEDDFDHYVLEISSFQLDGMFESRLDIAILLNITPDHLDRYDYKMENYVASKFRITQNQRPEDVFIYNADDPVIADAMKQHTINARCIPFSLSDTKLEEGAYTGNESIYINVNHKLFEMSIQDLALQGKHNINNTMASGIASRVLELRKDIIRDSLTDFQNIEHRLEFVTKVCGVSFVNDSKATNVNSTWYALETVAEPVVWIVGGQDKGNDYESLLEMVNEKVKAIIFLGLDNSKLHEAFDGVVELIYDASTMSEAVSYAYQLGTKGDTVLLSPACASFDLFDNYEDRGRQFKEAVRGL